MPVSEQESGERSRLYQTLVIWFGDPPWFGLGLFALIQLVSWTAVFVFLRVMPP